LLDDDVIPPAPLPELEADELAVLLLDAVAAPPPSGSYASHV
jgi:hypothetical protein